MGQTIQEEIHGSKLPAKDKMEEIRIGLITAVQKICSFYDASMQCSCQSFVRSRKKEDEVRAVADLASVDAAHYCRDKIIEEIGKAFYLLQNQK